MNILAIDSATKTGWATQINSRIESGVQSFELKRGESPGMRFMRFNAWLDNMVRLADFQLVAYEQAHHRGGYATELCVGFTTRIQEFATRYGIEYDSVHTGTLKKYTTGKGNASKEEMMTWFEKETGRKPIDDNEADAMAILKWATGTFEGKS